MPEGHGVTTTKLEAVIATGKTLIGRVHIDRYNIRLWDAVQEFEAALRELEKGMEEDR